MRSSKICDCIRHDGHGRFLFGNVLNNSLGSATLRWIASTWKVASAKGTCPKILRGVSSTSVATLIKLAEALEVEVKDSSYFRKQANSIRSSRSWKPAQKNTWTLCKNS